MRQFSIKVVPNYRNEMKSGRLFPSGNNIPPNEKALPHSSQLDRHSILITFPQWIHHILPQSNRNFYASSEKNSPSSPHDAAKH